VGAFGTPVPDNPSTDHCTPTHHSRPKTGALVSLQRTRDETLLRTLDDCRRNEINDLGARRSGFDRRQGDQSLTEGDRLPRDCQRQGASSRLPFRLAGYGPLLSDSCPPIIVKRRCMVAGDRTWGISARLPFVRPIVGRNGWLACLRFKAPAPRSSSRGLEASTYVDIKEVDSAWMKAGSSVYFASAYEVAFCPTRRGPE
jgi:hypothetical protein